MNDRRTTLPGGLPSDPDDEQLLRQVRAVLTPMPPVDRRAIADILTAVAARERTPRARVAVRLASVLEWWRFSVPPFARGSALVTAALVVGFFVRGAVMDGRDTLGTASPAVASAPQTAAPMVSAASSPDVVMVPMQFVLDGREVPTAATVSVVGDFNDWDAQAAPMVRESGAWTITLPMAPGRHVYAFVVDGERWVADPRAPRAPDADFGRPGSVVIVQTP